MSDKNTRRRCLDIKFKEDTSKRLVTFSKRRNGLFSKAKKLSDLTGAQIAVLVMSRTGRPYSFGCPSVDTVIDRFLASPAAAKEKEWWDVPVEGMGLDELRRYKEFLEGLRSNLATKQPQEPVLDHDHDQMVVKVETQCSSESDLSFWFPSDELVSLDDIFHDQESGFMSPVMFDNQEPFSFDFQWN